MLVGSSGNSVRLSTAGCQTNFQGFLPPGKGSHPRKRMAHHRRKSRCSQILKRITFEHRDTRFSDSSALWQRIQTSSNIHTTDSMVLLQGFSQAHRLSKFIKVVSVIAASAELGQHVMTHTQSLECIPSTFFIIIIQGAWISRLAQAQNGIMFETEMALVFFCRSKRARNLVFHQRWLRVCGLV